MAQMALAKLVSSVIYLRSEAQLLNENFSPEIEWPLRGKIEFENIHVQYNSILTKVLR